MRLASRSILRRAGGAALSLGGKIGPLVGLLTSGSGEKKMRVMGGEGVSAAPTTRHILVLVVANANVEDVVCCGCNEYRRVTLMG